MDSTASELTRRIRERALALGFACVGFAPATAPPASRARAYETWIRDGMHGEMSYLSRPDAVSKRLDPSTVVPGARSIVAVASRYHSPSPQATPAAPGTGLVAKYARGLDYHDVLKDRLIGLQQWISDTLAPVGGRAYVDTGPLLERAIAARAGLGWQGTNTSLIVPRVGSFCFLGEIVLDVELEYSDELAAEHCGLCSRCRDACPTGALLGRNADGAPVVDARRCVSYLTIELRGPIPRELRPLIANRIYGCDSCQDACPWNAHAQPGDIEEAFAPRGGLGSPLPLLELMAMTQADFSRRFRSSPIKRAKRRGLLRNVAVALGNWGSPDAVPALAASLNDDEPLIRGHSAWALGRIGTADALAALRAKLDAEDDPWVLEELRAAAERVAESV
eukprot:m51a1_g3300 hypothetical protein (393) ;mRNA; r:309155-310333